MTPLVARTTTITLSIPMVISAMKAAHPTMLDIQALPANGKGLNVSFENGVLRLSMTRHSNLEDAG